MKQFIQKAINSQITLYQEQPNRMVADYNSELQNIDDYNGRQLLELIQNADDAQAKKVSINLDTKCQKLTISNTGQSFSEPGYESLMLSNLSSKKDEQFIGNKGLGFRSIINWSEEVVVRSNGLDIKFSKAIAKKYFNDTFDEDQRKDIETKYERSTPWAVLATPEISEAGKCAWATEIEICYREEFQDDIEKQIESFQKETLLFLNHLDKIERTIDGSSEEISRSYSQMWCMRG